MHPGLRQHGHQAAAGRNRNFRAFFDAAPRTFAKLTDDLRLCRVIAQCQIEHSRPIELHLLDRDQTGGQSLQLDPLDDAMGKLWIDVDQRERRPYQAGDMNGGFPQAEHRDIEQFPQLVQPGIENVANQERVVTFVLGAKAILQHLSGVQEFEVAILLGNGPMRAQPL